MSVTSVLDNAATPQRLHALRLAIKQALWAENRGQSVLLNREYVRICTRLREEVAALQGTADAELLISLWSTAQISHAGGVEYAHTGQPPAQLDKSPV